jgi:hypothetical protein
MDKARHPHVMRTWRVERTKVPYRQPQPAKVPPHPFLAGPRHPEPNPHLPPNPPAKKT